MPITRIPIVHKFGIISQSQREELQDRLLQQSYLQSVRTQQPQLTSRNPLELSEGFVQQFNAATDLTEKEKLEEIAYKLLHRTKRRTGIMDGGKGKNVDLPKAWSELSLLAQCRGKIQEECFDMLIVSLNQAPLLTTHIPSLFYLAETTLYWLRTDAMDQPFLRIGEIKLLKMGQGVFVRLYYHHMAGHLHGFTEYKNRLVTYLSGVRDCETAYSPYPGAHLCLRFISEVGRLVVLGVLNDVTTTAPLKEKVEHDSELCNTTIHFPDQIPEENEDEPSPSPTPKFLLSPVDDPPSRTTTSPRLPRAQSSMHDLSPTLWHSLDVWRCVVHLSGGFTQAVRALSMCGSTLATEHWVDAVCALRVIAETAKSDLKVLRTLQNMARGALPTPTPLPTPMPLPASPLPLSPGANASPGESMQQEIAENNGSHDIGNELESIISGVSQTSLSDFNSSDFKLTGNEPSASAQPRFPGHKNLLSDFFTDSKHLSDCSQKSARNTSTSVLIDTPQEKRAELLTSPSSLGCKITSSATPLTAADISSARESLNSAGDIPWPSGLDVEPSDSDLVLGEDSEVDANDVDVTKPPDGIKLKREVSFDVEPAATGDQDGRDLTTARRSNLRDGSGRSEGTRKSNSAKSVTIDPVPNTTYYSAGQGSVPDQRASKLDDHNPHLLDAQGLGGWPWEVGFTYAELMSQLCLHGSTAAIQRIALVGCKKKDYGPYTRKILPADGCSLLSAGLLDLVEYQGRSGSAEDANESSHLAWRVRYAALLGLVRVTRCTTTEKLQDGMRTVAWNALMRCHSKEKDHRVLEAIRVGQVEAHIESQLQAATIVQSINMRLAAGLAKAYLPPLAPPVDITRKSPRRKVELPKPVAPKLGYQRLSLKQEILLANALDEPSVDFNTRTSLDLRRIVEDQWRKELQQQLEEEEKKKEEELKEERKLKDGQQFRRESAESRESTWSIKSHSP